MDVKRSLEKLKKLFSNPEHWTKGCFARDSTGWSSASIQSGVCWCLVGGISKVSDNHGEYRQIRDRLLLALKGSNYNDDSGPLIEWNDLPERKHSEVIALIDKAIEL
jgi:hypothetical protein